jgi:hypothetical protein
VAAKRQGHAAIVARSIHDGPDSDVLGCMKTPVSTGQVLGQNQENQINANY